AGLVEALGDVVQRSLRVERAGFERIVELGERGRAAVVPDVDRVRLASRELPAMRTREGERIRLRPVGVERLRERSFVVAGELRETADAGRMALRTEPDRERGPPVPVAGERPVLGLGEEISEPAVAQVGRDP